MSYALEGKIALITGGSRSIDAAIAKRPAADGASVAMEELDRVIDINVRGVFIATQALKHMGMVAAS